MLWPAFASLLLVAQGAREVTLALPHPVQAGETVWIEVAVGALSRSDEVDIRTSEGIFLGTISPFGARAVRAGGIYTIPLPEAAIREGRVSLKVSIEGYGHTPREPDAAEVKKISLKVVLVGRG